MDSSSASLFTAALPHASPPREGHPEVLPTHIGAFVQTNLPDLRRSIAAKDRGQIAEAFSRTAAACNGCHRDSGHGFIEVPNVPGRSIPNTDPVPVTEP